MKIDNAQLLSGVRASQTALQNLNKSVNSTGMTNGMSKLGASVDGVKQKFSLMNAAAVTAVATITNKLTVAGLDFVKKFTLDPVIAGFHSYEETINATKTIMSNTGASAKTTGKYLKILQTYANQTVYSFSEMAKNIGTFTAAGVKLPQATSAIKGIANLAALSGSNSQQASSAMYQLSQALSAGQVHLQDWNSVVNAGMGGKVFQTALAKTAAHLGTIDAASLKLGKDGKLAAIGTQTFRESIQSKPGQQSWLTSKVLATTLAQFSLDVSTAKDRAKTFKDLIDQGYSPKAAKDIIHLAQTAGSAATDIKTWSQLTEALKEEVATAWGQIFKTIFGGIGGATKLFSALHTVAENTLTGPVYALNNLLKVWSKLGGRSAVIQGIVNIWKALSSVFQAIGKAWREAFPNSGQGVGKVLADISKGFEHLTENLIPSKGVLKDITSVFKAVFQVFGVGVGIVYNIAKYFGSLFGLIVDNGGGAVKGLLAIVGAIGRMVSGFLDFANLNTNISKVFDKIEEGRAKVLGPIIKTIGDMIGALQPLLHGDFSGFGDSIKKALGNLSGIGDWITGIGSGLTNLSNRLINMGKGGTGFVGGLVRDLKQVGIWLQLAGAKVADFFKAFGSGSAKAAGASVHGVEEGAKGMVSIGDKLAQAWHGFIAGLEWLGSKIGPITSAVGSGIGRVKDYLEGLFGSMDKMSLVQTIQLIFSAAVFVYIKRFMDSFKGALDGFKEIGENASGALKQLTSNLKSMQNNVRSKTLLNIALSVGILAGSLWILSKIPAKSLGISLAAMTGGITLLVGAMAVLTKAGGKWGALKLPTLAASLVLMATALSVLAGAVMLFAHMSWKQLEKGFAGVAASLTLLVGTAVVMGKFAPQALAASAAILILSFALTTMAGTLLLFSKMKWSTIFDGLAKVGVTLVILGAAMSALTELDGPIIAAAVAIGILAVSLDLMAGTLTKFSKISMGTIIKSMIKIAIVIGVLAAIAAVAAGPLAALGGAIALLGLGVLAAGAGMALFGVGLATLAATGTAAFAVIIAGINTFLAVLPLMGIQFIAAITTILQALAKESPKIVDSLVTIGENILRGFVNLLPSIATAAEKLIETVLGVIVTEYPKIVQAGVDLILALLRGLGQNGPKIMDQMGRTMLQLLQGLDQAINTYEPQIIQMSLKIGRDIIKGLVQGLVPAPIRKAFSRLVNNVLNFFKGLLGIHSPSTVFAGFGHNIVQGLVNGLSGLASALGHIFTSAFSFAKNAVSNGIDAIVSFIRGIPGKISSLAGSIGKAAKGIGTAIWHGITSALTGVGDLLGSIKSDLTSGLNHLIGLPKAVGFSILGHHVGITIPGFARGTDRFGGGLAMVGEAGAELVSMPGGSSVITNKNLVGFMKAVNDLASALTKSKKSVGHEGSIIYKVGAHFQGDPKKNGMAFAGNLLAGLKNGLESGQNGVNTATSASAKGLTKAFAKELGIHSPSKVFEAMGFNVTKGFVNGIMKSMASVIAAGKILAQNTVDAASKTATMAQQKADALQAKADALRAAKNDKKYFSSLSKAQKAALNNQIKAAQKAADVAQGGINSANAAAAEKKRRANASDAENASVFGSRANAAAKAAEKDRQDALKLSKEADLIRSKDAKRAAQLDKQAKDALAAAQKAANNAKSLANTAQGYAISAATKSQADVQKQLQDSLILAKGTDAQKLAYYQQLQKDQQKISDDSYAQAQKLLDKAKAEEKTNAAQSAKDTAAAAALITKAEDAASQASDAASQASQYADQASTDSTATQNAVQQLQMPDINIASNAVFGAQNMFDAYAKALTATVAAAADSGPTINLTQNNTSPKALSASEIYRNTQNLLSNTERKLTGTPA